MARPMKYYSRDPMGKGRGAGYYYPRSYKGKKNWYSKYSEELDAKRKSKPSPYKSKNWRHAGDNESYKGLRKKRKKV